MNGKPLCASTSKEGEKEQLKVKTPHRSSADADTDKIFKKKREYFGNKCILPSVMENYKLAEHKTP